MKPVLLLSLALVACSDPTESAQSAAEYFVAQVNDGRYAESLMNDEFLYERTMTCVAVEACAGKSDPFGFCYSNAYKEGDKHFNCGPARADANWFKFIKGLHAYAPCTLNEVVVKDVSDWNAKAKITCDGKSDWLYLAKRSGRWRLSGNYATLPKLRGDVLLDSMVMK